MTIVEWTAVEWTAPELAEKKRSDGITIIDVREPWEQDICLIPGSQKIPLKNLPEHLDELAALPGDIIFICHHGVRSINAAVQLAQAGKPGGISLKGGVAAWSALVDTNMPTY